ncbi:MAG: phosphoribosylformylglycinamidine cyclo-ligase [Chloroflexota bacterium]|nr:phosphoribosylformylglycinamidine cyclo-ligase [Chloroflexota bacterium]
MGERQDQQANGRSDADHAAAHATATTYRDAGVDRDAAGQAIGRIAELARATFAGGEQGTAALPVGHFGGAFRLPAGGDRILIASADGVGTKLKLAFLIGGAAHGRVGGDLVNHCLNDILALAARPLFFLDYVAMGKLETATLEALVGGMATACQRNGLALLGGESAEMPGFYADGEYDAAGFIVGEVAPDAIVDGSAISAGNVLFGLPSTGLHTNGYSLARRIVGLTGDLAADRARLARPLPGGGGESIGEALLQPHRCYRRDLQPLLERRIVTGMAHITGGGLIENLPRMLPVGTAIELDPTTWQVPPIFTYLVEQAQVPPAERYRAFNMGIGFVLSVQSDDAEEAARLLAGSGAVPIGRVVARDDPAAQAVRGLLLRAAAAPVEERGD